MKTVELKIHARDGLGKKAAKGLRRSGKIPTILYGRGVNPTPLVADLKEFYQAIHTKAGANILITLKGIGSKTQKDTSCLIKEIQRDPVTDEILHVDFAAVSLAEKIRVKVPLVVKEAEEALGVKEGGILDQVQHEIEVECLPTEIPDRFEVSVKALKIGEAIRLKELKLPSGVIPLLEGEEVVVALHPPSKEEEVPVAAPEVSEPEVIEKGKKEKEEEAPEAAAEKPAKAERPEEKKPKPEEKKPA